MPPPRKHPIRLAGPIRFTRRRLLLAFGGTVMAGAATGAYGTTWGVHQLVTEHVTVRIPGLAPRWRERRIVHLSDLHGGNTALWHIDNALRASLDLRPEFLLITGDLFDNGRVDPAGLCNLLRSYTSRIPILASTGNHDFGHRFSDNRRADQVCNALEAAGVRMLRNAVYQPIAGPGELCFAGIDDYWSDRFKPRTLLAAPPDASVIVLSHNPDSYDELDPYRFHLMLAGHTHGGQVCIPFIGPIKLPVRHRERAAGLFHLTPAHPHRALYVSRGVGHGFRMRLFCPPEITCITLQDA